MDIIATAVYVIIFGINGFVISRACTPTINNNRRHNNLSYRKMKKLKSF